MVLKILRVKGSKSFGYVTRLEDGIEASPNLVRSRRLTFLDAVVALSSVVTHLTDRFALLSEMLARSREFLFT